MEGILQNASVRILTRKWTIEEAFLYGVGAAAPLLTSCINLGLGAILLHFTLVVNGMSKRPDGHCKSRGEAGGVSSECDWRRIVKYFDETLKKVGSGCIFTSAIG